MNIHLPAILGFTGYQGFDPSTYVYGCVTWAISNHWKPEPCTARDLLWLSARLRLGRQGLFHHRQVLPLLEVPITTTGRTPGIVGGDAFLGRTNQIAEIC